MAARRAAILSLTSLTKCTHVGGCLLGCKQERREVCCSSFVVWDFKRNFLIWCTISRIYCICQAAEVRHQPVRGSGCSQSETCPSIPSRSCVPTALSGIAPRVLAQLMDFGCSSLGRKRDSLCGTKQFSHNFYRQFYAFLYCLQNLYKTIILKEVKWIKLLWSWNGSCALELFLSPGLTWKLLQI